MATKSEIIKVRMDPDKEELLAKSKEEFARRRKVVLGNIPDGVNFGELKNTILQGLNAVEVTVDNRSVFILFKNVADAEKGVDTLRTLNYADFAAKGITINFPEPDSLLFIGNLPFEVDEDQLGELMSQFGKLERVFLVRSEITGESKGYGFAEYTDKKTAGEAKQQLLNSGAKYISGRILRVDFAEPNLRTYKDLHSKTLFLDKLPRDFTNSEVLKDLFSQSGKVTYAQVAISVQTGTSRGFAFVDYETSEEAERGQIAHNNAKIGSCNIRTSYGTPGRSGASVLGPCTSAEKSKPVSLMSATVPTVPPPNPLMNPRPLMSGPMICPDPSAHMIRGRFPMPLMAAGPQMCDPRAGFFPGPGGAQGMFPGGGPPQPGMSNPRGPNPIMAPRGQPPRPMAPRGPSPGRLQGPQGNSGPVRPLMGAKPGASEQLKGSTVSSSQGVPSNNLNNQQLPQPLMQSKLSGQQQNPTQGPQSLLQANSTYNGNNTQPSLSGQQLAGPLNNSGSATGFGGTSGNNTQLSLSAQPLPGPFNNSGIGTGFGTGQGSGNGPRPLMSSNTWGGNQSLFSNNNAQQYPSQGGSGFPGQNSMSYQPTGQTGGYQPQFQQQNTSFINNTQSQLNQQQTSAGSWQQQQQGQSQQQWQSMYQQQQYGTPGQALSSNNQSFGNPVQPNQASAQFSFNNGSQAKKRDANQTIANTFDTTYNKRPRY